MPRPPRLPPLEGAQAWRPDHGLRCGRRQRPPRPGGTPAAGSAGGAARGGCARPARCEEQMHRRPGQRYPRQVSTKCAATGPRSPADASPWACRIPACPPASTPGAPPDQGSCGSDPGAAAVGCSHHICPARRTGMWLGQRHSACSTRAASPSHLNMAFQQVEHWLCENLPGSHPAGAWEDQRPALYNMPMKLGKRAMQHLQKAAPFSAATARGTAACGPHTAAAAVPGSLTCPPRSQSARRAPPTEAHLQMRREEASS